MFEDPNLVLYTALIVGLCIMIVLPFLENPDIFNSKRKKFVWEILVPASSKEKKWINYQHHKSWDAYVRSVSGGLTIFSGAKGEWESPDGTLYRDRMIPVRIACTKDEIKTIAKFTIKHYAEEAVLYYKVSSKINILHDENN